MNFFKEREKVDMFQRERERERKRERERFLTSERFAVLTSDKIRYELSFDT